MNTFKVKAGKNSQIKLVYKDQFGHIIDITGATALLVAREGFYTSILVQVAGSIVGASGEITFDFVPADTANVLVDKVEKRLLCDVELTLATGEKLDLFDEVELLVKQSAVR
jgi:hypothetical protein